MTLGYGIVYIAGSKRECGYELGNCKGLFQTDPFLPLANVLYSQEPPQRVKEWQEIDSWEPLIREGSFCSIMLTKEHKTSAQD